MSNITTHKPQNPAAAFSKFMDGFKGQMALALPKHLTADRMARLALSAFSSSPQLQQCDPRTIAASIMTASTLGLEPGVNGQGYLIPYKTTCTFVPGWKGLVDIANRSGRVSVWTGAVHEGDHFEYALGDNPFIQHRPGDEDSPDKLTHVYAVGRVNGSNYPVIEVWSMKKVWKHRDKYNKVGNRHYSYRDEEMYARKVPLLQVLKYMPASIELSNAVAAANAADTGREVVINGDLITIKDDPVDDGQHAQQQSHQQDQQQGSAQDAAAYLSAQDFERKSSDWRMLIETGKKTVNGLIAFIETKDQLTSDQKMTIASWAAKA
jgi:recombination protein RecT